MEDVYFESVDSYEEDARPGTTRSLEEVALDRPIRTLTLRKPLCLEESQLIIDAVRLMREHHMGSVLITRDGVLTGIFTERDVLNQLAMHDQEAREIALRDAMRADPEVLTPQAPMAWALNLMSVGGFRHVPLIDERRRPVAVVAVLDIVNYLVECFPDKVLNVPPQTEILFPDSREGA
jgi:CBS domain-containing protein